MFQNVTILRVLDSLQCFDPVWVTFAAVYLLPIWKSTMEAFRQNS